MESEEKFIEVLKFLIRGVQNKRKFTPLVFPYIIEVRREKVVVVMMVTNAFDSSIHTVNVES